MEPRFEWDPAKAEANFKKHSVRFAAAADVFKDDFAITIRDLESDPGEERFVTLGADARGRILVVVYCYRMDRIRMISARLADPRERSQYEEFR